MLLAEHARRSRKIFYYPEHAQRTNFLCSVFCSTSKYSRAEDARRAACSMRCSPNISEYSSEHARRACSPSNEQKYEPGLRCLHFAANFFGI
uniref:Uncharacterized protein n=1 Tax=Romanomermis culicivorax TaxID=13658 RepID=A0A915HYL6_ROMCU